MQAFRPATHGGPEGPHYTDSETHYDAPHLTSLLQTLLGLNRAGRILWTTLFVLAVPALTAWFVLVPRLRFHDEDERLFRAARHGDRAGVERSLAAGGQVNAIAPID